MKCPGCGREVEDKLWFCPHCETSLRDKGEALIRREGASAPELEEAVPEETPAFDEKFATHMEEIHHSIWKSWVIRIGIAVFLIALLIGLLLLLSRSSAETSLIEVTFVACAIIGLTVGVNPLPEERWGISLDREERIELERIVLDDDDEAALMFLRERIYPRIAELEKSPHGCLHVALDRREQEMGIRKSPEEERDIDSE